ncbi:IS1 family transposase [Chroococcus sp. FPU101]|uniref:IS1 family transposase n=1 Tax=Chroococcus sp. FPU101 TaxID=1974212 RepID=UPI001A8E1B32
MFNKLTFLLHILCDSKILLILRTRLKRLIRQTICFSQAIQMHNLIISLFNNIYKFGLALKQKSIYLQHSHQILKICSFIIMEQKKI